MKLPLPLHPVAPVSVHVPEMVLPATLPWRVSTFFVPVDIVVIIIPNVPATLPLKLPLRLNEPVCEVCSDAKQEPVDVKVKSVTLRVLLLPCVKVVEKLKAGDPSGLVRAAVQVPLMLPEFDPMLLLPHPAKVNPNAKRTIIPICLYTLPPQENPNRRKPGSLCQVAWMRRNLASRPGPNQPTLVRA